MKGKIGYGCIVFLTLCLYIWTNVAVTFYLFTGLVLFAFFMWICNVYLAKRISLEMTITQKKNESERFLLQGRVLNTGYLPGFRIQATGTIYNCLTQSDYVFVREISVPPKGEKSFEITFESDYCGRIEVEVKKLQTGDFLGVFWRRIAGHSVAVSYAYPARVAIEQQEVDVSAPDMQNIQNRYLRRKGNDITEILDIRDYQKGDSIKTIHWKLSKKMGRKVVRELDTPANQEIIILLALSEEYLQNPQYRHTIVAMAGSISEVLLREEKFFDSVVFDEEGTTYQKFNVEESYTCDRYQQRLLDGTINFQSTVAENYMHSHNVVHKYAFVILVTDEHLAGWCSEYGNVRQVCVRAS